MEILTNYNQNTLQLISDVSDDTLQYDLASFLNFINDSERKFHGESIIS